MSLQLWLAFVAASAVLLIIPGPTILTVISYSVAHGRRANVPLVAAVALGDSTALVVSLLGLGALLATSAFWFTAIKWVGGLYLLYLGIKLLRAGISPAVLAAPAAPRLALEAVRQHLSRHRAQPQGHRLLRRLPAAVHRSARRRDATAVGAGRSPSSSWPRSTPRSMRCSPARRARLLASPRAQRRFNLAGGSLLSAAGVWALLARRPV